MCDNELSDVSEKQVSLSMNQFSMGLAVIGITAAGRFLQAAPIEYRDVTTVIFDEPLALQRDGGRRNTDAAHAEHEGQKFVGDPEVV